MVLESVTSYIRENNSALIVVEHDISRAKSMANRLLVIDDGRVNPFTSQTKSGGVEFMKEDSSRWRKRWLLCYGFSFCLQL